MSKPTNSQGIIRSSNKALSFTSKIFSELRTQITDIFNERNILSKELNTAKSKLALLTIVHIVSYLLIFGFFYKRIAESRVHQKDIINQIESKLSEKFITINFVDESQLDKSWTNCLDMFAKLMLSEKIWDVIYTENVDRVKHRTTAGTSVERTPIKYSEGCIDIIRSDVKYIFLPNVNGPDVFIYPTLLILYEDNQYFGIFDLLDVQSKTEITTFIEEDEQPNDSELAYYTWKYANKDGSPDKRFNNNYQIPVMKYGELNFEYHDVLQERYIFSNAKAFMDFEKAFNFHLKVLSQNKHKLFKIISTPTEKENINREKSMKQPINKDATVNTNAYYKKKEIVGKLSE